MPGKPRRASHSSHVEHTEFKSQPERQRNRYGRVKRATLEAKRLAGSIAAAAMNSNARVYPKRGQNQLRGNSYRMNRPLATLLSFQGTVIPMTLRSFELWFFMLFHIALVIISRETTDEEGENIFVRHDLLSATFFADPTTIVTSYMGILLIFFNQQCYERYEEYFRHVVVVGGTLEQLVSRLAVYLEHDSGDVKRVVERYVLSSVIVVYFKVTAEVSPCDRHSAPV